MSTVPIRVVHYVEDSDDEVFLARRVLRRTQPSLTLTHYERFVDLERHMEEAGGLDAGSEILVLDLNLKLSNGIDCVRALRAGGRCADLLIGLCSGSQDPVDRRDALASGADFFAAKPLIPSGLLNICGTVDVLRWVPDSEDGLFLRLARDGRGGPAP